MNAVQLQPYLIGCGYDQSRLAFDVEVDWPRRIPVVAFAHSPHDSRSACVAVLDEVADPQVEVTACRGVGAPLVFAPSNQQWQLWKQGTERPQLIESIAPSELTNFFLNRIDLSPESVYRAKTWARFDHNYQLSFVDLGLMPLVEEQAGRKLSGLIERVVTDTKSRLGWLEISYEQGNWLLKSSFWLLAGKILRDKKVPAFDGLQLEDLEDVFARVATHYGAIERVSPGTAIQSDALRKAAMEISRFSNLELVTIEALAYLYENALITKATRTELGTHSTPSYLVDYIVGKLRPWIQDIHVDERQAFEPACGHAAFLLSSMRLLSELLPLETSPRSRRSYLRERLHGCDIDPFALEIARLSLTLSDVPNPNGWDLKLADMFEGNILETASARANIILANPPFKRAAEMLTRVVSNMQVGAVLGVVLPQGLLHSKAAIRLRETISTKFEIGEICLFPDKVFAFSDAESAVLLARCVVLEQGSSQTFAYKHVREREIDSFKRSYQVKNEYRVESSRFSADNDWDFLVPDLQDVWEFCASLPKFEDVALIGKGFDFRSKDDPSFPSDVITLSNERRKGFVRGFVKLHRSLQTHELPKTVWLNLDPAVIKTARYGINRGSQQVLLNYGRVSRGPWRLKAFLDWGGHPVSSRFLVVRPKDSQWPLEALWGICNSPFANAYSYAFSSKRDVLAGLMRKMPIPDTRLKDLKPLISAVRAYRAAVVRGDEDSVLYSTRSSNELRLMHWQIDAEVLNLYGLPVRLEREVLTLFSGVERRGVPFSQTAYFPRGFSEPLRLRELLALARNNDWDQINERRANLILKEVEGTISPIEQSALNDLQQLVDAKIFLQAPLPTSQLEKIKDDLQKRGIWEGSDAIT